MPDLSLVPFQLKRPKLVSWEFICDKADILECIRSKSLRSFLRQFDQVMAENNLRYEHLEVDAQKFAAWLPFYQAQMQEKGYDQIASLEWFEKHRGMGEKIESVFFYQKDQLVGSAIILRKEQALFSVAFKASLRLEVTKKKNGNLGSMVDFACLKIAVDQKADRIFWGRSRNAFGVINTFGNLEYKIRFGLTPVIDPEVEIFDDCPYLEESPLLFYANSPTGFGLYGFCPQPEMSIDINRFQISEIPYTPLLFGGRLL